MKFTILVATKKIPTHYKDAVNEYTKRLSRYCKTTLIQTKSEDKLKEKIPANQTLIGISPLFNTISSPQLADMLSGLGVQGQSNVTFIITHQEDILDLCTIQLGISSMSLSPELTLVSLLEQIYRSFRIINNQAYHK